MKDFGSALRQIAAIDKLIQQSKSKTSERMLSSKRYATNNTV